MKRQLQWTVGIVVLCALLLGCGEVLNEYYISNHTDVDLTVRLTPLYTGQTVTLSSGPLIEDVRKSARSSLQQSVSFHQDGEAIQFTLPAKTTVFLGSSSGGNTLFSQLEVRSKDWHLAMDRDDYKEHFSVHDRFVGAIVHVFNVK
jgi:hypothetical protein